MAAAALPALRALLAHSVDYAGLFPPAGLALVPALDNQAAYSRGIDAWMLGRFVLPITKFHEAAALLAGRFDAAHPLRISALFPKLDPSEGYLETFQAGLRALVDFRSSHGEKLEIDQFEVALPPDPVPTRLRVMLQEAATLIGRTVTSPVHVFWEVPFSGDWATTFDRLAEHNALALPTDGSLSFGVKLRTGGLEPHAFPTTRQLADVLLAARDARVPLKFTAGLHGPVRHFDEALGTSMHGFLNVFVAGVLGHEHVLDAAEIQLILEDEHPESFHFDAGGLTWRDRRVSTAALTKHRQFITSFGSCSFDDPRDDLRRLGFLH